MTEYPSIPTSIRAGAFWIIFYEDLLTAVLYLGNAKRAWNSQNISGKSVVTFQLLQWRDP